MVPFSVVSMMRETPEVVQRFVDYYRALGATEIFVYFNGPSEDLPPVPGCTRIDIDTAFWERHPNAVVETIEDRMRLCWREVVGVCRTPWLLICDADEYVFSDRPLSEALASVPDDVDSISFPTAEAVWGPGDDIDAAFGSTCFRTRWRNETQWRILRRPVYGSVSALMRWGVLGHIAGKHMIRTDGRITEIGAHRSMRDGVVVTQPAAEVSDAFANTYLGHFDAISLSRWEQKWRWRIEKEVVAGGLSRMRQGQMRMVAEAMEQGRTRALFQRFYGLTRPQFAALKTLGHVFRRVDLIAPAPGAAPGAPAAVQPRGQVSV